MTSSIPVETTCDVMHAQRGARASASALGFRRHEVDEIAIVASELATNILKYGVKGTLSFSVVSDPERGQGIGIVARDQGPPFRNFATALEDGHDDTGPIAFEARIGRAGSGTGLGAVRRFTDLVEHLPFAFAGKEIRAVRFLRRKRGVLEGVP